MTTRAEQRRATRAALLAEGRRRFASDGYRAVALDDVARQAGVTKGAAYHHFGSKAGLFRAVVEEVQQEVAAEVVAAAESRTTPWDCLTAGCHAFLTASAAAERQRVLLVDGPAVLGWQDWRALDDAASVHHLAEAISAAMASGALPEQPVTPLVRLLSGAMNEAALWLAETAPTEQPSVAGRTGTAPGGDGPEGAGTEGAGPEGTGPEGTGPEGTGPEGAGPGGAGPEGAGTEGAGPDGAASDGAATVPASHPLAEATAALDRLLTGLQRVPT